MLKVPLSLPAPALGILLVGDEERELVLQVIDSGNLFRYDSRLPVEKQGAMAATLERECCEKMGVAYSLAVTSGSAALEVALGAMGVGPGDEVIVPAWSWVACFTSIVRLGARPVLAEVDETFCLAPGEIRRLCTPRTRAAMVIHYQGAAAEMDALVQESEETGVPLLEDCAQSFGVSYKGKRVGTFGAMGIYSFQHNKVISSGEGGMVVTSDARLYERAIRLHDLGMVRPFFGQFIEPQEPHFAGGQYRMNELTAAVALAQLRKLDAVLAHCRRLNGRIMAKIEDLGLTFRHLPDAEGSAGFELYICMESQEQAGAFSSALRERNVYCGRMTGTYCHYAREYCIGAHSYHPQASPFRQFEEWPAKGYRVEDFPRTEGLIHRFVSIPIGVNYTDAHADGIGDVIREALPVI